MSINLLPWREQRAIRRSYQYGLWLLISILGIILITTGIFYYLNFLKTHYQRKNIQLAQQIAAVNIPNDLPQLTTEYQTTQQQIQLIRRIQSSQTEFWREISWLQQQSADEIQLVRLNWTSTLFRIEAITGHADKIGWLVQELETSGLFSQVILENIDQTEDAGTVHFAIHAGHIQESSV